MTNDKNRDEKFMRRALELAKRGGRAVFPNPMVGAVLVRKEKIIANAFHKKFGGAHAEKFVLPRARHGDTLYVTLEPCVEFSGKKTPPCVDQIIKSGIKRVVVAMKDPNPHVFGRGINALKKAKIRVSVGCLEREAMKLNMPFITLKIAMTLDGKIATKTGDSKWITSEKSRQYVKSLRDKHDAILVGINTVLRDNPELKGARKQPLRIILDSYLRIHNSAKVLRDSNVLIVTTDSAPKSRLNYFSRRKIACKVFPNRPSRSEAKQITRPKGATFKIHIAPLLQFLSSRGIKSLLVEGGSEVFGSFIDARLFDRILFFIAPKIIGGRNAKSAVGGKGIASLKKAIHLSRPTLRKIGSDFLLDGFEFVNMEE